MANPEKELADFVERLTDAQRPLYSYIRAMLGASAEAQDVLQETNLDLWAKARQYNPSLPFLPWAVRFAYIRVLGHRKSMARSKLVFSDEVLQLVDQCARERLEGPSEALTALSDCLDRLPQRQRELVRYKYEDRLSLADIGERLNATVDQLSSKLYRIRQNLMKCIRFKVGRISP